MVVEHDIDVYYLGATLPARMQRPTENNSDGENDLTGDDAMSLRTYAVRSLTIPCSLCDGHSPWRRVDP